MPISESRPFVLKMSASSARGIPPIMPMCVFVCVCVCVYVCRYPTLSHNFSPCFASSWTCNLFFLFIYLSIHTLKLGIAEPDPPTQHKYIHIDIHTYLSVRQWSLISAFHFSFSFFTPPLFWTVFFFCFFGIWNKQPKRKKTCLTPFWSIISTHH